MQNVGRYTDTSRLLVRCRILLLSGCQMSDVRRNLLTSYVMGYGVISDARKTVSREFRDNTGCTKIVEYCASLF